MKKKHAKILQSINRRVYEKHKDKLVSHELIAPDYLEEAIRTANDPELTDYQRQRAQNIVDSGMLSETEIKVDQEAVAEFEAELELEIEKAIKAGKLPEPKEDELINKVKQYGRRETSETKRSEVTAKRRSKTSRTKASDDGDEGRGSKDNATSQSK